MFHKSTRAIVTGKKPKSRKETTPDKNRPSEQPSEPQIDRQEYESFTAAESAPEARPAPPVSLESPEAALPALEAESTDPVVPVEASDEAEAPAAPKQQRKERQGIQLPKWLPWAALGALCLCIGIVAAALIFTPKEKEKKTPLLTDGRTIVSVPADAAICAVATQGDVVQLCRADGTKIDVLQYVQVYEVSGDHLLLLVDSRQQETILGTEISTSVALVTSKEPERSVELLTLQAKINYPQIALRMPEIISLLPGTEKKLDLEVAYQPKNAVLPEILWTSSDPTVAAVDAGWITAGRIGEAVVSASCGGVEVSCRVTVRIPVSSLAFPAPSYRLYVGDALKLDLLMEPVDATDPAIAWISSDPTIADVSQDGVVVGNEAGVVTVTARVDGQVAEVEVIIGYRVTGITLNHDSISIPKGTKYGLIATISPGGGVIDVGVWQSSKPSVATVDENGVITGKKKGSTVVSFSCGGYSVKCTVKVTG